MSENFLILFISILSTWRVSVFICFEDGPFSLGSSLRRLIAKLSAEAVGCFDCTSLWIAGIISLFSFPLSWSLLLWILAVAGGASALDRFTSTTLDEQEGE